MLRSIKEFFLLSYKNFKTVLILNVISVLPVYIFLLLAVQFLFNNVFISKKFLVTIKNKNIEEPFWVVISKNNENEIIIGVSERGGKRSLIKNIKENRTYLLRRDDYLSLIKVNNRQDNIYINFNKSSMVIDIKDIKKDSITAFRVISPGPGYRVAVYTFSGLLFFIFISLFLYISTFTKDIAQNRPVNLQDLLNVRYKDFFKSAIINIIYLLILVISILNVNYLKNYNKIGLAVVLVVNFWILIFASISYMWVFPVASHFGENSPFKIIKKALLISFDNILKSIFIILLILIILISMVSILTIISGFYSLIVLFIFPGLAGLFLLLNIYFKHILEKY